MLVYAALILIPLNLLINRPAFAQDWVHLSTTEGDLPLPTGSTEQTAALILDVDLDGLNDFVIASRQAPGPALVWYRRNSTGWTKYIIDNNVLPIEAGGAYYDIDGDGDLDIVMGGDFVENKVWWWENPYPTYAPNSGWTRRLIKNSGANKHHDQLFGDFDGDGRAELAFWNQYASALLLAEIPADPRTTQPWPFSTIYSWSGGAEHEGLAQADIDGDGKMDIIGGGRWFKHNGGTSYTANVIDDAMRFGRVAVGQFIAGGRPEVLFVCGDCNGPLKFYTWNGTTWSGRDLLGVAAIHGHSLAAVDMNDDGHLDIFVAEMRLNGSNPNAKSWILTGDGAGNFTRAEVSTGYGNHESKVGDLDGDGDFDILGKPYNWETPRLDIWLNGGTCRQSLTTWQRHLIDPTKPSRSIFVDSADLDGDQLADVVTGGWWYKNPGQSGGNWVRKVIGAPLHNMAGLYDFDNDGDIDILGTQGQSSDYNANFAWARNDGAGNFTILTNIPSGQGDFLQGIAIDRFQPGGALEVALSWHQSTAGVQMLTVPADPANSAWQWRVISSAAQDEALSSGDIDRDGALDLLQGTAWLRNQWSAGAASGPWNSFPMANEPGPDRNRLGDLNNDGRLDAVVGFEAISVAGKLAWYEQPIDPTGPWTEHLIANTVIGPMSLDLQDMDHDGDLDVVVGEHNLANPNSARMFIFENLNGDGSTWRSHTVYTGDEHHDGAHVVDIDNDGDYDIVSIGWGEAGVVLYENQSAACGGNGPRPTSTPRPSSTPRPTSTPQPTTVPGATATPNGSCATSAGNVVRNGTFEGGTTDWAFYTNGGGSLGLTGDAYECTQAGQLQFSGSGSNMQLFQTGIALQPNTRYRLSFAATSNSGHDLGVYLHKHTAGYNSYGLDVENVDLTSNWQHFSYEFTSSSFASPVNDGRLRFWFVGKASAGDRYRIDDVRLEVVTATPPTMTPTPTAPLPTSTSTMTNTPLPAATVTATATATPTTIATATMTTTPPPVASATATVTPTSTPQPAATATATVTPTETLMPTATPTEIVLPTATPNGSCATSAGNLVRNGTFEGGTTDWAFYTNGGGSLGLTGDAYECTQAGQLQFSGSGSNMQLFQTGIALQPNTRYRLSFAATSNSGHDLGVYLHKHTAGYNSYGLDVENVDLTSNWQHFSYEFTSGSFASPVSDGRLRFWFVGKASAGDRYRIDDVRLEVVTATPPTVTPTPTAPAPTPTMTNTPLPAATVTATATATPTTVATATMTTTPPPAASATATFTPTSTPQPAATATMTPTETVLPTATPNGGCATSAGNLVRNGTFEGGTTDWAFYTNSSGNFGVSSDADKCTQAGQLQFNGAGSNVQLFQTGIALQPNTRYRLSFTATSNSGHDLGIYLHKHTAGYNSYGLGVENVDLTSNWQHFSYEFTSSGFASPVNDGRLRFWFVGKASAGDLYRIENITLTPVVVAAGSEESQSIFLPLLLNGR